MHYCTFISHVGWVLYLTKVKVWKQGDRKASRLTVVVHKKPGETLVEVDEPFCADL